MVQDRRARSLGRAEVAAIVAVVAITCFVCSASSMASEDMPASPVEISVGSPEGSNPAAAGSALTTGVGCPDAALTEAELDIADSLIRDINSFRQLPVNEPVVSCVLTREQLRERFLMLFERDSDLEQLRREGELLKLLGFVDPKVRFLELILSLLEDEVVGFYDPVDQRLYVVPSDSAVYDQMTLAHELVHALQDQSFDLESLLDPSLLISDPASSRSALVEGDAIIAGLAVAGGLQETNGLRPALLRRMAHTMWQAALSEREHSAYLMRALVAPYASGTAFVASLLENDGWRSVDAAFAEPPTSTEQVLHPERYLDRDEPTWLEFASLQTACHERTYVDIRGEFDMRNVLAELRGQGILDEDIVAATTGWDGDRLEVWSGCFGQSEIVVHASVWDSQEDAVEYFDAAASAFSRWLAPADDSAATPDPSEPEVVVHPSGHGARAYAFDGSRGFVLERWGDQVVLGLSDSIEPAQLTGAVRHASESLTRFAYPPLAEGAPRR